MPEKLYTTGEVAKIFGVSYVAVKKWAYSGKIKYIKTPGKYSEIKRLLGEAPKGRVAIYARVSSADQKKIWKGRNKDLSSMLRARGYKPEWIQANEMLRMRAVKNTRWMQELPFTPKASHEKMREGMKVNARPER